MLRYYARTSSLIQPQQRCAAAAVSTVGSWFARRFASEKGEASEKGGEGAKKPTAEQPEEKIDAQPKAEEKPADAKFDETVSKKMFDELEKKFKEVQKQADEFKKEYAYATAEADNARRIGREDAAKARDFSITAFGKDMVEVADTLEKAVEQLDKVPAERLEGDQHLASTVTGVRMSVNVLHKNMAKHGIEKMDIKHGLLFDPNKHDALFNAPATEDIPAGHITNVVKSGWGIKERVLRAAQVGVAQETPK